MHIRSIYPVVFKSKLIKYALPTIYHFSRDKIVFLKNRKPMLGREDFNTSWIVRIATFTAKYIRQNK